MIRNEKAKRDPLFHISKRETLPFWKSAGIRAIAIVAALLLSGILSAIFIGVDPFTFIGKLFEGVFGTERRIWTTLRNLSVLLLIALALAPAFKMKFWNIGAEGQVLIGGLACAVCMYFLGGKAPDAVVYLCMAVSGILAAALWAVVPAIFKAFWGTNETLFTLMMNYVAMQAVSFFTSLIVKDGSGTMKNATHLHGVQFPQIGNAYLLTILVAVVLTVGMWIYLRYSKHGYELSVVGESENTARYIGINVKKVIIRTMALSGAICGVAGVLLVGAINGTVTTSTAGGQGFTAIIVAWLGKFNPVFMILTSFLLVFLEKGTSQLDLMNNAFASMITGIVFFFIIGCEFFVVYRLKFRRPVRKESASDASVGGNAETPPSTETESGTPTEEKSEAESATEGAADGTASPYRRVCDKLAQGAGTVAKACAKGFGALRGTCSKGMKRLKSLFGKKNPEEQRTEEKDAEEEK